MKGVSRVYRRQKSKMRQLVSGAPRRVIAQWRARASASARTEAVDTEQFWFLVELELERARRGDRHFALSTIDMRSALDSVDAAIDALVPSMRTYDTITEIDGVLVLMLAEADRDAAAAAVGRLSGELTAVADVGEIRTVVFPDDSFSVDTLLERLTDRPSEPTIELRAPARDTAEQRGDSTTDTTAPPETRVRAVVRTDAGCSAFLCAGSVKLLRKATRSLTSWSESGMDSISLAAAMLLRMASEFITQRSRNS